MEEKKISLSEKAFEVLISGKIVKSDNVYIILQDIGYDRMLQIIEHAKEKMEAGE